MKDETDENALCVQDTAVLVETGDKLETEGEHDEVVRSRASSKASAEAEDTEVITVNNERSYLKYRV